MRYVWLLAAMISPATAGAQASVNSDAQLRSTPDRKGRELAVLRRGAPVRVAGTRGSASQVMVEGYIHSGSLGSRRDTFAISVRAPSGAFLRASPERKARVVAQLRNGMGLVQVARRGEWVHVRRTGWIATRAIRKDAPKNPPRSSSQVATTENTTIDTSLGPPTSPDDLTPGRRSGLSAAPGGRLLATLEPGTRLTPVARDRGWVRVQVDGWIRESDAQLADSSVSGSLSSADLRANPESYRGRIVRWDVQIIAAQTADPLRRDMAPDEPYLLARGPGAETALLYLAMPPSLVAEGRAIPPLSNAIITARVRTGRSDPSGVPILDLLTIARH